MFMISHILYKYYFNFYNNNLLISLLVSEDLNRVMGIHSSGHKLVFIKWVLVLLSLITESWCSLLITEEIIKYKLLSEEK